MSLSALTIVMGVNVYTSSVIEYHNLFCYSDSTPQNSHIILETCLSSWSYLEIL